jgi:hypothetical protein
MLSIEKQKTTISVSSTFNCIFILMLNQFQFFVIHKIPITI